MTDEPTENTPLSPEEVHFLTSTGDALEAMALAPGWYPIEVSAGGDGIARQVRYWSGQDWGEVRDATEEEKAVWIQQEKESRTDTTSAFHSRLSDDPTYDPATSDIDGDGISDAEELRQVNDELGYDADGNPPERWFEK